MTIISILQDKKLAPELAAAGVRLPANSMRIRQLLHFPAVKSPEEADDLILAKANDLAKLIISEFERMDIPEGERAVLIGKPVFSIVTMVLVFQYYGIEVYTNYTTRVRYDTGLRTEHCVFHKEPFIKLLEDPPVNKADQPQKEPKPRIKQVKVQVPSYA